VTRKPLSEGTVAANVLKHGCGAINIDRSRVPTSDKLGGGAAKAETVCATNHEGWDRPWKHNTEAREAHAERVRENVERAETLGRWPANLLLSKGSVVDSLDAETGILTSGLKRAGAVNSTDPDRHAYGSFTGYVLPETYPADKGYASRFFKQVTEETMNVPQDLLDYLYNMITPTHVGGETLIVLDLNAQDWASIADEHYHGVIARGEPTSEQTAQLMRIVKPGAHVLLIAPDENPVGYKGACAMEDRGFEVRDCILWVTEPGRLHYVPKANSKERNLGCEKIAAKRKGVVIFELTETALGDEELIGDIQEALLEAGVAQEVVDALEENGIQRELLPEQYKEHFRRRAGGDRYGNFHPCVKPKAIMARVMRDIPVEATVVDPFMGSGSTLLACLETGHNGIGIEREQEYLEIADARVRYWDRASAGWIHTEIISDLKVEAQEKPEEEGGLFDLF
jgi:DNA modification methylase